MHAYALFEYAVIGGALLLSLWTVLGKLAPARRAAWLAKLRGRAAPVATQASGCVNSCCGSGDGCDTPQRPAQEQPLRFHRS